VAALLPAVLGLCEQFVRRAATIIGCSERSTQEVVVLLEAALVVARAVRDADLVSQAQSLRQLGTAAGATIFRAALRALAQLQRLSGEGPEAGRHAAAPLLLELPPLLARVMDALEPASQLAAWLRVAAEALGDGGSSSSYSNGQGGGEGTERGEGIAASVTAGCASWPQQSRGESAAGDDARRWVLRFCARCMARCAPLLPQGSPDIPAWEVLTELSRLHQLHAGRDEAWDADRNSWYQALEEAGRIVCQRCPAQAREFLLLAACAGSPVPASLERLL